MILVGKPCNAINVTTSTCPPRNRFCNSRSNARILRLLTDFGLRVVFYSFASLIGEILGCFRFETHGRWEGAARARGGRTVVQMQRYASDVSLAKTRVGR